MKQEAFLEILSQGLIASVTAKEAHPSKGKSLTKGKLVWVIHILLHNGNASPLISSRGTTREWASLDTLSEWLKGHGVSSFRVSHLKVEKR